ncbi:MAG: hypothetical protein HFH88_11050 [Lachnospiraceae bacterium]|nr:hypothetical protein [Lachnospiraceae bacterium]
MGIGYVDSVIVYNRYVRKTDEAEQYFGTRFDNVRVELTQGANITKSGLENANACIIKVNTASIKKSGKSYKAPKVWEKLTTEEMVENFTLNKGKDFFVIVNKADMGIDVDLPEGMVDSDTYAGGFFEYVKNKYGYAYSVDTVDVYTLIPRFEIGGK